MNDKITIKWICLNCGSSYLYTEALLDGREWPNNLYCCWCEWFFEIKHIR